MRGTGNDCKQPTSEPQINQHDAVLKSELVEYLIHNPPLCI